MAQVWRLALVAASLLAALLGCAKLSFRSPSALRAGPRSSSGGAAGRRLGSDATSSALAKTTAFAEASDCGKVERNVDYQGGDLSKVDGIFSATACATECWSTPACKSYTYAEAQETCYLKGEVQPGRVESSCCVSGLRPCVAPSTPPPPKIHNNSSRAEAGDCGKVEMNVDYRGGDLSTVSGIFSATACASECWLTPACKSYTYAKAQETCFLKGEVQPGRAESSCCVSGLRPCVAPPTPPPRKIYNYSSRPVRGVAYAPLPCKEGCSVSEDMLQEGYQALWGPAPGRDDLRVIKDLGANLVRLYHSIGLDGPGNHGLFLDRAEALGLDVMPGYHTYNAIYGGCPDFDCYDTWKSYTLKAFEQGFRRGNSWHPAVSVLLLFNELDFFRGYGKTVHAKATVSALDGVLAAEREAGVEAGRVKLSIAWSNAPGTSLDGEVTGLAIWAFHDVAITIANPAMVQYSPRTPQAQMEEAFRTRWAHSINVQTPGILEYMTRHYYRFEPTPWFIGEYGANGLPQEAIEAELATMDKSALEPTNPFMGMAFFQFQAAYFKGGSEMNFGLFRLGDHLIGETGEICDKGSACKKFPVYCLTTDQGSLPEFVKGRADAVAAVWGGEVDPRRMC